MKAGTPQGRWIGSGLPGINRGPGDIVTETDAKAVIDLAAHPDTSTPLGEFRIDGINSRSQFDLFFSLNYPTHRHAKLALDVATGTLMEKYNIVFDEAKDGNVSRRPDPIPDVINQQQNALVPGQIGTPAQR